MATTATIDLGFARASASQGERVFRPPDLRTAYSQGELRRLLLRFDESRILVRRLDDAIPLKVVLAARLLARNRCQIMARDGSGQSIGWMRFARIMAAACHDRIAARSLIQGVERKLEALSRVAASAAIDPAGPALCLKTDLWMGFDAGGSVGHLAGVVNAFAELGLSPTLMTPDDVPLVGDQVQKVVVRPRSRWWPAAEHHLLAYNDAVLQAAGLLSAQRFGFVYHRHGLHSFAGLAVARARGLPLILEYNGSEVWLQRQWSDGLALEALAARIELANLSGADGITVVSRALGAELVARGIPARRILVVPNGVDCRVYTPTVDGSALRRRLKLDGARVIGFIGTFGAWHGAEMLVSAFASLVRDRPALPLRMLLVGDGPRASAARELAVTAGIDDRCIFTGLVGQAHGPEHLAACDILVAPTVPNADGTAFFGSPTKLFEYMAMGRPIVASRIGQVGEIVEHGRTALLHEPGDAAALIACLGKLLDDPSYAAALGRAARAEAERNHSWTGRMRMLLDWMAELAPRGA